jgi:hypothetical protein
MIRFPYFLGQLEEFRLAMNRIQQFLVCDEINTGVTNMEELKRDGPKSANLPDDIAFEFQLSGCFHWGLNSAQSKLADPEDPSDEERSESMHTPQSAPRL